MVTSPRKITHDAAERIAKKLIDYLVGDDSELGETDRAECLALIAAELAPMGQALAAYNNGARATTTSGISATIEPVEDDGGVQRRIREGNAFAHAVALASCEPELSALRAANAALVEELARLKNPAINALAAEMDALRLRVAELEARKP